MNMHRHILLLGLGVCLAGCGASRTKAPVEIVYWTGWSSHEFDVQQELVDEFNRQHPDIRVRLLSQFGNSGYQKVRIAFAGGSTPDVMSTVWADELASYAKRGVLHPLDDDLKGSGRDFDREFVPGLVNTLKVDGKVYGLAATSNTQFIVYNKTLFQKAGITKIPTTVDELDRAAKACTVVNSDGTFARYGFRPANLTLMAYTFGGKWFDPVTKRITANDPHNVAALKWMASYSKNYDLKRIQTFQATFGSETTPNGPFFVGKIAMWGTGEWAGEFLHRYAPDIDYGYFANPAPADGNRNATYAGGSVFVIPEACKHKAEAWEFLNWFTSPYAVKKFCTKIKNIPPLKSVGMEPEFQKDPLMKFAVNLSHSENAFGPPAISIWPSYTREIARAEEAATLGKQDPQKVLDDLQFRMQREYERSVKELGG